MIKNILVIGGTGKTGKRIVNLLNRSGYRVRVGSRKATPSFDWHDPEGWPTAVAGMDAIYITYQPDLAVPGALEAIEELVKAAKRAKVQRLVLLSGKGEREAQLCEQVVIHSGLEYTIVRASWFNQNFSENFLLEGILKGSIALPYAEVKIPFVDVEDIAAVASKALTEDHHNGEIYELTGPEGLTFREAVEIISNSAGKEITFAEITIDQYVSGMKEQGLPKDFVWLIEYLFTEVLANHGNHEITQDIEKVLSRKPVSFKEYAENTAYSGVWNVPVDQPL